jgi:hypothetical protein
MHKKEDLPCKICGKLKNIAIIIDHYEYEHNNKALKNKSNTKMGTK